MGGKQSVAVPALGLSGSGKSLLFSTMIGKPFDGKYPGIHGESYKLQQQHTVEILPLGVKKAVMLASNHLRNRTNFVFVVDSTDPKGMVDVSQLIYMFFTDERSDIDISTCTVLVYTTKQDKESAVAPEEVAKSVGFDGERLVPKKLVVQGTSMVTLKEDGEKGWADAFG